jgi:hypothetical protein
MGVMLWVLCYGCYVTGLRYVMLRVLRYGCYVMGVMLCQGCGVMLCYNMLCYEGSKAGLWMTNPSYSRVDSVMLLIGVRSYNGY